ncbi:MAG: hypothetical protein EOM06_09680 [Sphingobacteriia bacterium]|nr:hypothetical protein [Sphingobacteriia bacterium]
MENVIGNPLPGSLLDNFHACFYMADFEKRTMVSSIGNISNILGEYPSDVLMFPPELAEELQHPKDRAMIRESLVGLVRKQSKNWSGFYRIRHFDGDWVWVYSKIIFYDGMGVFNQLVAGMIMDIQASIPAPPQLETMIREAARYHNAEKIRILTPRELMIVKLIAEGHCYKDIAGRLFIQPDTVNKHRKNILSKLGLKNIAMLACFAKETGLV